MNYVLKISTDFGVSYPYEMSQTEGYELLRETALKLEKEGEVRWVIVDESDTPLYWCQYHEANLRVPKDSVLATDDPYMEMLAKRYGFRVLHTLDILMQMGMDENVARAKLASIKGTRRNTKEALEALHTLVAQGIVEEIPCGMEEDKIGKELFGDGIKN